MCNLFDLNKFRFPPRLISWSLGNLWEEKQCFKKNWNEKIPFFSFPCSPPSRFCQFHATILSLSPILNLCIFFVFFCFLWQNNTLGIHIRWFITVTWLCCSYFTSLCSLFVDAFQSCLSNPLRFLSHPPNVTTQLKPRLVELIFHLFLSIWYSTRGPINSLHHSNKPIYLKF